MKLLFTTGLLLLGRFKRTIKVVSCIKGFVCSSIVSRTKSDTPQALVQMEKYLFDYPRLSMLTINLKESVYSLQVLVGSKGCLWMILEN